MKQIFLLGFIVFSAMLLAQSSSSYQQKVEDNFRAASLDPSMHDTLRFQAYVGYTKHLANTYPDSTIILCKEYLVKIDKLIATNQNPQVIQTLTILKIDLSNNLAHALFLKTLVDQSYEISMLALEQSKKINYQLGLTKAYNNLGSVYKQRSEYAKALEYYHLGLAIEEQLGDARALALFYSNIGTVHTKLGDYDLSITFFLKSLSYYEEAHDTSGIAVNYNNLAIAYRNFGKMDLSLEYLEKSLALKEILGDRKGMALTYNNIGAINYTIGNIAVAIDYYEKSIAIREEINDQKGLANVLGNVGVIYLSQEDFLKALIYLERSLAIREALNDRSGIGTIYNNLASLYNSQGNAVRALEYYSSATALREELGEKQLLSNSLNNMGVLHKDLGDYTKANSCFDKALEISTSISFKEGIALSYANLGSLKKSKSEFTEALIDLQKAHEIQIEIDDKLGIVYSEYLIGTCYLELGDTANAYKFATTSFNTSKELGFPDGIRTSAQLLFKIVSAQGNYDQALYFLSLNNETRTKELERNYFSMSEREKEFYFSTMEVDFMLYYEFTVNHAKTIPALADTCYNLILRNKGLALKSSTAMRQSILNSNDTSLINLYDNWIVLKKEISENYSNGKIDNELDEKANLMERELVKRSTLFSDFSKIKNLDWHTVKDNLKKGEAAVEFFHYKESQTKNPRIIYAALIVTAESNHPSVVKLFYEDELETFLRDAQGNNLTYVNTVYGLKNKKNNKLYQLIWQPMESDLKGIKTVFLSPSGLLHKISFAAIAKNDDVYLCDSYQLNFESSTGNITTKKEFLMNDNNLFTVVGGINYNLDSSDRKAWDYLPGTLSETEKISSLIENENYSLNYYTNLEADETKFKLNSSKSNFIHIATHGFFFPDPSELNLHTESTEGENLIFRGDAPKFDSTTVEPGSKRTTNYATWSFVTNKNPLMRSGLVFAGANSVWHRDPFESGDDGILTAQEVSSLDLRNTQLVVLSACETGLGEIRGSEGVYGLQRAFKMAGVHYIIMSLWQVPDLETAEFMSVFYKNLFKTKDVKKAFSTTQQFMRKKYDPYYWAAFVLIE